MEIYKRGQGTWARAFAIVVFIIFIGWGAFEVHRIPAEMNVIVKPGDIIWRETAEKLMRAKEKTTRVRGLANQPVGEALLRKDVRPARRIENAAGHGLVLENEEFDRDKIKAIEDAGIRFVPVFAGDKLANEVEIGEWIRGRMIAEDVTFLDTITVAGTERGKVVDAPLIAQIIETFKPYPAVYLDPFFPDLKKMEENEGGKRLLPTEITEGLVCGRVLQAQVMRTVVAKDNQVNAAVYETLRNLRTRNFVTRVRIADEGALNLAESNLDEISSRYLVAVQAHTVETWWSSSIFTLPLVKVRVTPGLIISIALFVLLTGVALWSWNLTKWNDLLIETQTEMKKVSWPKRVELIGSSTVVIVSVVVLGLFLYVVDLVLTTLANKSGLLR